MKVKLLVDKIIGGKRYGKDSVIDVFQPEVEALINDGEGCAVPDGTMARKKAYGVVGCMPPAGFVEDQTSETMSRFFAGAVMTDAKTDHEKEAKQKTNTLKK